MRVPQSEYEKPLSHVHFRAEGDVEFRALLYVPERAPPNFLGDYTSLNKAALKLYVRRVFISDDFEELIPRCAGLPAGRRSDSAQRLDNERMASWASSIPPFDIMP